MQKKLKLIYRKLFADFGAQGWWPAETPFEVVIGAILTQNTNWNNVARAIHNLKRQGLLRPRPLYRIPSRRLAALIRPSGYFNLKAKRLKSFLRFLFKHYRGNLNRMFSLETKKLRQALLGINGIGPETADSILLYAAGRPVFVVDAYTKRIFSRMGLVDQEVSYEAMQDLFMRNLAKNARLFNEYHALLVRLGKEICVKKNPRCNICPLDCRLGRKKND